MAQSPVRRSAGFLLFSIAIALLAYGVGDTMTLAVHELHQVLHSPSGSAHNTLEEGRTCGSFRFVAS